MDITGHVTELQIITAEEKQARSHLKKIVEKRKALEAGIARYLEDSPDAGIMSRGVKISLEHKEFRRRKSKRDRVEDAENILRRAGVRDACSIIGQVTEAMRGDIEVRSKLHIKKV